MNKTELVNEAMFFGIRCAMIEEKQRIPTNAGYSEELMKVKS